MEQALKDLIKLTGFSDKDAATLKESAAQTQPWVDEFVQAFYDTLYSYESTATVFKEGERSDREETLRQWYLTVTSGEIDEEFWKGQWIAGLVHIPRHVVNPFMIGIMSRVQQLFLKKCIQELDPSQAVKVFVAFKRTTDVITGLIAEGYFSSYVTAMERIGGLRRSLVDRMMAIEIKKIIAEFRG